MRTYIIFCATIILAVVSCGDSEKKESGGNTNSCVCDIKAFKSCGQSDLADKDYDRDGTPNCKDDDIDGDGILNDEDCSPLYSLKKITTCDNSDLARKDYDGDGIKNCEDDDIDGDGVLNPKDCNPYKK